MKSSARPKWFAISLMAVVLPMGILVGLKLTGIIPNPQEPEDITVEVISWNMSRPSNAMSFVGMKVRNHFCDDTTLVGSSVHVSSYAENSGLFGDCIWFTVNATANLPEGFIYSVLIRCRTDSNAFLLIYAEHVPWLELHNLEITRFIDKATYTGEAYVYATAINHPKTCHLKIRLSWHFLDLHENDLNHWTTITLETTYFNGTAYRKVITPIKIGVVRDAGNAIDDPNVREIGPGTYNAFVGVNICPPGFNDVNDYYKMWVEEDHVINITMKHGNNNFNLYLYDPMQEEVACSENEGDVLETIQHVTTSAGYWYIRVKAVSGNGIYVLRIEI